MDQNTRFKALIIDDEYPAREELRYLLGSFPEVEVVGEATSATEAFQLARSLDYSILFLDILMPGKSGMELAREITQLNNPPLIVFTTAYEDFALEAFSVNAVDYLLKPYDEKRLAACMQKVMRMLNGRGTIPIKGPSGSPGESKKDARESAKAPPTAAPTAGNKKTSGYLSRIPVHKADKTILVDAREIVFINSADGYCSIKLHDEKLLSRYTLKDLQARLQNQNFFRAHRCYLVNLDKVKELIPDFKGAFDLVVNDSQNTRIPVSRRRAQQLRGLLGM